MYRYLRTSRPAYLAPLVPLSFFMAYQLDISFGSQIRRAIGQCERASLASWLPLTTIAVCHVTVT